MAKKRIVKETKPEMQFKVRKGSYNVGYRITDKKQILFLVDLDRPYKGESSSGKTETRAYTSFKLDNGDIVRVHVYRKLAESKTNSEPVIEETMILK